MARTAAGARSTSSAIAVGSGRRADRLAGPLDAVVVDVMMGHEADDPGRDRPRPDPLAGPVLDQLGRVFVPDDPHVRPRPLDLAPAIGPTVDADLGQSPDPPAVVGPTV